MSNRLRLIQSMLTGLTLIALALPGWSQDPPETEKKQRPVRLVWNLGPQDVILPVTSVEWGIPDRWSLTARYIHMFDQDRDDKPWLNNFTISLSPGTDGGRLGIGYQGIYTPPGKSDMALFAEARAVLLRTWGNPLETEANRTFAGIEVRGALSFICNVGVGWYRQVSSHEGPPDSFWGMHIGFGI